MGRSERLKELLEAAKDVCWIDGSYIGYNRAVRLQNAVQTYDVDWEPGDEEQARRVQGRER
jgi:hypothetical protein